jgi:hypothetical protein
MLSSCNGRFNGVHIREALLISVTFSIATCNSESFFYYFDTFV